MQPSRPRLTCSNAGATESPPSRDSGNSGPARAKPPARRPTDADARLSRSGAPRPPNRRAHARDNAAARIRGHVSRRHCRPVLRRHRRDGTPHARLAAALAGDRRRALGSRYRPIRGHSWGHYLEPIEACSGDLSFINAGQSRIKPIGISPDWRLSGFLNRVSAGSNPAGGAGQAVFKEIGISYLDHHGAT